MADPNIGKLCFKKAGDDLCYCVREGDDAGKLIFYIGKFGHLMTWWDFDPESTEYPVNAYINGTCVCEGHATTHIVEYDVIHEAVDVVNYDDGSKGYRFTMSITGVFGYCNFRCWESGRGWDDADEDKKAEVVGTGRTVARFELLRNTDYSWKLRAI